MKNAKITELFKTACLETIPDMGAGHVYAGCPSRVVSENEVDGLSYKGWAVGLDWMGEITSSTGEVVAELCRSPDPTSTSRLWAVSDKAPNWLQELDTWEAENESMKQWCLERDEVQRLQQRDYEDLESLKEGYHGTRLRAFVEKSRPDLAHLV